MGTEPKGGKGGQSLRGGQDAAAYHIGGQSLRRERRACRRRAASVVSNNYDSFCMT